MNTIYPEYINVENAVCEFRESHPSALIAISGRTNSGKTTLARYLSWASGITALETDMFLRQGEEGKMHDLASIKKLLEFKKKMRSPLIIEGCVVTSILKDMGINQDYLIYVEREFRKENNTLPLDSLTFENTVRCVADVNIFGDAKFHADTKSEAQFIVSIQ